MRVRNSKAPAPPARISKFLAKLLRKPALGWGIACIVVAPAADMVRNGSEAGAKEPYLIRDGQSDFSPELAAAEDAGDLAVLIPRAAIDFKSHQMGSHLAAAG